MPAKTLNQIANFRWKFSQGLAGRFNIFGFAFFFGTVSEIRRQKSKSGENVMMELKNLVSNEQKLKQRIAKLQADLARKEAKKKQAVRQLDSRRKIILGGVLIAAVRAGGITENSVRKLILAFASERDKAVFEEFEFETPARAESYIGLAQETAQE